MRELNPLVSVVGEAIVGYADVQASGLIDHFYVHKDWQRRGVGTALMRALEAEAHRLGLKEVHSRVSLTARPFFERSGFSVIREQEVVIDGVRLRNVLMARRLSDPSNLAADDR